MSLALEAEPETGLEAELFDTPETETEQAHLGTSYRRIPLSFEVSGAQPGYTASTYEEYAYAFRTVFASLAPAFVSIAEMQPADEPWVPAYIAEPGSLNIRGGAYRSIIDDASRHGPASRTAPIVSWPGKQEQDIKAELDWYAETGVENILVSPSNSELSGGEPDIYQVLNMLHIAQDIKEFKAIGIIMRLDQSFSVGREQPEYEVLAARLRIADFGVTLPLMHTEPYARFIQAMADTGIRKPVTPGLMAFQNPQEAEAYASAADIRLPWEVVEQAEIARLRLTPPESHLRQVTLDHTVQLAQGLVREGAQSLHVYTRNHVRLAQRLVEALDLAEL